MSSVSAERLGTTSWPRGRCGWSGWLPASTDEARWEDREPLHSLVDCAVAHLVGRRVHLPRNVDQLDAGEIVQELQRFLIERTQRRALHLVPPSELPDHQLAVRAHPHLANTPRPRAPAAQ